MVAEPLVPEVVLRAYGWQDASLTAVDIGLINQTLFVDPQPDSQPDPQPGAQSGSQPGARAVLQRLNPIFGAEVNEDLDAVTRHLQQKGLETPTLIRTRAGERFVQDGEHVWRALTFIDGVTHTRLQSPAQARQAGLLLGRFHAALSDLDHEPVHVRLGIHDTAKHLAGLKTALATHRDHPRYDAIAPLGEAILTLFESLAPLDDLPKWFVHGDPKISNLLFYPNAERARCWVDLDTLGKMPLAVELGDAFRSWCNLSGEDDPAARFDLDLFSAGIEGYARGADTAWNESEGETVVRGVVTITGELAARFAKDALEESYFGWDATRFASRSHHNEVRARGQLDLAHAVLAVQAKAEAAVAATFASPSA